MGEPARLAPTVRHRPSIPAPEPVRTCNLPLFGETISVAYCDGLVHFDASGHVESPCPDAVRHRITGHLAAERARLAGLIRRLRVEPTFATYDANRHPRAGQALAAAQAFVEGQSRQLLLAGGLGLGKTHLLLASHLALVARGVRSDYVTCTELRQVFDDVGNFREERRQAAETRLHVLWSMDVIHLDELGDGQGDPSGRFYQRLKDGLDTTSARFAVGACRSSGELAAHPDVTPILLSRFLDGAGVVWLEGDDQRLGRRS